MHADDKKSTGVKAYKFAFQGLWCEYQDHKNKKYFVREIHDRQFRGKKEIYRTLSFDRLLLTDLWLQNKSKSKLGGGWSPFLIIKLVPIP